MGKAEDYVELYLKDRVEELGGECFKFTSGVRGVPDRVIVLNGHTVFVEAKAPKKKPTKLQRYMIKRLNTLGSNARAMNTREAVDAFIAELMAVKGVQMLNIPEEL